MENFNLSLKLVILRSLTSSLLSGIRWVSFSVLLLTGLSIVTFVVCFGCGVFFWPRPMLSAGVCLVENVAAGHRAALVWEMEPSPAGQRFVLRWELTCPRSKLMTVDRKG